MPWIVHINAREVSPMAKSTVEGLKAKFTRGKERFELMALSKGIALYRVTLITRVSYHVGHVVIVPESEPELSGVTTPAHEDFKTDAIQDNERDAKQAYYKRVLEAKPAAKKRKKATVTATA
jgi:hypothetical protein